MAVDAANDMKHLEQCNVIQSDLREWWHDMLHKLQFFNKAVCLEHGKICRTCQTNQNCTKR